MKQITKRVLSAVPIVLLFTVIARGDDWSLTTTADLQRQSAVPRALSSAGLRFIDSDGKTEHLLPLEQFVAIQRAATDQPPTPNFTLVLSNGDRLVGDPGTVSGERLIWLSPTLGKVPVPFNRLIAINRGLNFSVPDESPKQDIATLNNGDTVAGVFTGSADRKITLQGDNGPVNLSLDSIKRLAFAPTATAADEARAFRLRLNDGSLLTVADLTLENDQLKITLKGKNPITVNLPITSVLGIEQTDGPVSWLSSHTPIENIQTPYFIAAQTWPAKFDSAVDGSSLCVNGHTYDRGIGVHAYSRITFKFDPQWAAFCTQYGIDSHRDERRKFADVTVRIKLDDKVVCEEKHVREGTLSKLVLLDLKGAKTLTLECDYGDAGDTQAHLDWLQPALLRAKPAPTTRPTE